MEEEGIRFGLEMIKDMGKSCQDIINNRPYKSFEDFIKKTKNLDTINKRSVLIKLTKSGLSFTLNVESEMDEWIEENTNLTYEECEQLSALLDKVRSSSWQH
jgi:DNA polymerase III alpha subunit